MAKIMKLDSSMRYEAELVAGMYDKTRLTQYELYKYCADYFKDNYRGVFFSTDEAADEIFQNTFITLWENIEKRKIYAENGKLMGKDKQPLRSSLTTYFMGIARFKYLEYVREHSSYVVSEKEIGESFKEWESQSPVEGEFYENTDSIQLEIIADLISQMSPRCRELLTLFYYEKKTLDDILLVMTSITTKDVLKTKKNKCMNNLRQSANDIFYRYINA